MTKLYFLLPYGNICSLIRLFYKISYIFMIRKIVRKCAVPRIRPQDSVTATKSGLVSFISTWSSGNLLTMLRAYKLTRRRGLLSYLRELGSVVGFVEKAVESCSTILPRLMVTIFPAALSSHSFSTSILFSRC